MSDEEMRQRGARYDANERMTEPGGCGIVIAGAIIFVVLLVLLAALGGPQAG